MKLYNSPSSQITLFTACAILALLASAVSRPVFAQAHHAKFNGSFADGVACGSDGLCNGVTIGRNGAGSAAETFLSFFSNRFDPVTNIFTNEFGMGIIPNEALAGDTPGQSLQDLSLNLDIARVRAFNPDFIAVRVTCLPAPCPGCQRPCSGGPILEGTLTAIFDKTDAYSNRSHGTFEENFKMADGSFLRFRSVGMSELSSATWTVNFFGIPINVNFVRAEMGVSRGHDITVEKTIP